MAEYTIEEYNTLKSAIAQGATVVMYGDKRVEYRSLKEMMEIKNMMAADLGLNGATTTDNGRRFASFSKGIR